MSDSGVITRYLDLSKVGNRLMVSGAGDAPAGRAHIDVAGADRITVHARAMNGATWSSGTASGKAGLMTESLQDLAAATQITPSLPIARSIDVSGDAVFDLVVDTAESGVLLEIALCAFTDH